MVEIPPPPGAPVPPPPQPLVWRPPTLQEQIAADVKLIRVWVTVIGAIVVAWAVLSVLWFLAVVAAFS